MCVLIGLVQSKLHLQWPRNPRDHCETHVPNKEPETQSGKVAAPSHTRSRVSNLPLPAAPPGPRGGDGASPRSTRRGDSGLIPELRVNHSHFLLKALDCLEEQPHHFLTVTISPLVCKAGRSRTVCGGPVWCPGSRGPGRRPTHLSVSPSACGKAPAPALL